MEDSFSLPEGAGCAIRAEKGARKAGLAHDHVLTVPIAFLRTHFTWSGSRGLISARKGTPSDTEQLGC